MVNGSHCLMYDGALSFGAPDPQDSISPPRQRAESVCPGARGVMG